MITELIRDENGTATPFELPNSQLGKAVMSPSPNPKYSSMFIGSDQVVPKLTSKPKTKVKSVVKRAGKLGLNQHADHSETSLGVLIEKDSQGSGRHTITEDNRVLGQHKTSLANL